MSTIFEDKARQRGWQPPEGLSEEQRNESAIKFLAHVRNNVQQVEQPVAVTILIVTVPTFFLRRNHQGGVMDEISDKTVDAVAHFDKILVICSVTVYDRMLELEKRNSKLRLFRVDRNAISSSMQSLTSTLLHDYGVKVMPPQNRREMSWLNLDRYVSDPRVIFVGENDHAKLGLTVDKELSFRELVRKRSDNDWL